MSEITVDKDVLNDVVKKTIDRKTEEFGKEVDGLKASIEVVEKNISNTIQDTIENTVKKEMSKNTNRSQIKINEKYSNGFAQALYIIGRSMVGEVTREKALEEIRTREVVHPMVEKNINSLTEAAGGALMEVLYDTEILPALRQESALRKASPVIKPLVKGVWQRPGIGTGATATWRGEAAVKTVSNPAFLTKRLDAKNLSAVAVVSDQVLRYGNPNTSRAIQNDLIMAMADKEDETFFTSTGSEHKPIGLDNLITADQQTAGASGTVTPVNVREDILKLFGYLADAKIKMRRPAMFMSPTQYYELAGVQVSANGDLQNFARTLTEENRIFGVPVYLSTNISAKIYLVEMSHVLLGEGMAPTVEFTRGGGYYDSTAATYVTGSAKGESTFTAEMEEDFGLDYTTAGAILTSCDYSSISYS